MKIIISAVVLLSVFCLGIANAQFSVSYHQSSLPFIGLGYEIKDRFLPELRISSDRYFEDIALEAVATYQFINRKDIEFYAGAGARGLDYTGLVFPIGFNIYPLWSKRFGFHIEVAPMISEVQILRGSWGIRYRFLKEEDGGK